MSAEGASYVMYAVLERSESLGIESLDHEVFHNEVEAQEHAQWCHKHLTGSYAEAGDTVCEVVEIVSVSSEDMESRQRVEETFRSLGISDEQWSAAWASTAQCSTETVETRGKEPDVSADRETLNSTRWWDQLTPLQRIVIAVLRAAMSERVEQNERKRLYEEAIYGRP